MKCRKLSRQNDYLIELWQILVLLVWRGVILSLSKHLELGKARFFVEFILSISKDSE